MAKRKTKKEAAAEKLRGTGPDHCHGCKLTRPEGPLPYMWSVHCVNDDAYIKGYRMPLCCSDECRQKGGFSE